MKKIDSELIKKICLEAEIYARELIKSKIGKGSSTDYSLIISFDEDTKEISVDVEIAIPKRFKINVQSIADYIAEEVIRFIEKKIRSSI